MSQAVTIQDLMDLLPEFFQPSQAVGVTARIGFDLSGEKGGVWGVVIENQTCQVIRQIPDRADLLLIADAQVVLDIFTGRLDAMRSYLTGSIKLNGNMGLAMQLPRLFKVDRERLSALGGGMN